jgi:hypothetical protein
LFGSNSGRINNVGLVDSNVQGNAEVGGLVGYLVIGGKISNSFVRGGSIHASGTGPTYDSAVGGLVGYSDGHVDSSYVTGGTVSAGNVSGNYSAIGGLIGVNFGTTTTNGSNFGVISNSFVSGTTVGSIGIATSYSNNNVGGLVGLNRGVGKIMTSYVAAGTTVSGTNYIGGLAGSNAGSISNSYAAPVVTGAQNLTGGLVGFGAGAVTASFWDSTTTGQATSVGGVSMITTDMKKLVNFNSAPWDISATGGTSTTWRIYEGNTMPLLTSFLTQTTVTANDETITYSNSPYNGGNGLTVSVDNGGNLFAVYSGNSQGAVNAGAYVISALGTYSDQLGYDISYVDGILIVNTAPLSITATDGSKTYGDTQTYLGSEFTSLGLVNSETIGGVTLASSGDVNTASVVGSPYSITASGATGGTFDANNYNISYVDGTLTIDQTTSSGGTQTPGITQATIINEIVGTTDQSEDPDDKPFGKIILVDAGTRGGGGTTPPLPVCQ